MSRAGVCWWKSRGERLKTSVSASHHGTIERFEQEGAMSVVPEVSPAGVDKQDVINEVLAVALQTAAAVQSMRRATDVAIADLPEAAPALVDTAVALISIRDSLLRVADSIAALQDGGRADASPVPDHGPGCPQAD